MVTQHDSPSSRNPSSVTIKSTNSNNIIVGNYRSFGIVMICRDPINITSLFTLSPERSSSSEEVQRCVLSETPHTQMELPPFALSQCVVFAFHEVV